MKGFDLPPHRTTFEFLDDVFPGLNGKLTSFQFILSLSLGAPRSCGHYESYDHGHQARGQMDGFLSPLISVRILPLSISQRAVAAPARAPAKCPDAAVPNKNIFEKLPIRPCRTMPRYQWALFWQAVP
jgi:hypothetical protein